jgi:hypothetical protein
MEDDFEALRAALQGCPDGHSDQSSYLNELADSLYSRFEQKGVLSDLDEAIDLDQAALALQPLVIPVDQILSTTLPSVSIPDSSGGVPCLTWMRPLT